MLSFSAGDISPLYSFTSFQADTAKNVPLAQRIFSISFDNKGIVSNSHIKEFWMLFMLLTFSIFRGGGEERGWEGIKSPEG